MKNNNKKNVFFHKKEFYMKLSFSVTEIQHKHQNNVEYVKEMLALSIKRIVPKPKKN